MLLSTVNISNCTLRSGHAVEHYKHQQLHPPYEAISKETWNQLRRHLLLQRPTKRSRELCEMRHGQLLHSEKGWQSFRVAKAILKETCAKCFFKLKSQNTPPTQGSVLPAS